MEINNTLASHDTALPTLSSPPTASVSTHWQHIHIKIANVIENTDASPQHNMQCGMQTPTNNQQLLTMLLHEPKPSRIS